MRDFQVRWVQLLLPLLLAVACSGPEKVADCDPKAPNPTPCKNPVVLVPGLGASVLDVRYDDAYKPLHDICEPPFGRNEWSSGLMRLWPSVGDVFPEEVPEVGEIRACRLDDMALRFDPQTRRFSNAPGVQVRPRGWGCVDGISNLFEFDVGGRVLAAPSTSSVYQKLIERLTEQHGYVIGQSLLGAPYDFRMAADDVYMKAYFAKLKALIEETWSETGSCESGNKRVFVVGHSLGNPVLLYFLNTYVDAAWKAKYIRAFFSLSGPWTGSPKAYRTALSGDSEGMAGHNLEFLAAERLMGGLLWMAPSQMHHADKDFVSVDGVEYGASAEDFQKLFGEIAKSHEQVVILNEILAPRAGAVVDPGVLVACLYGKGLPTEAHYTYASGSFDADPVIDRHEPGDGTVTLDVLEHCKQWAQVAPRAFEGAEHLGLLHREDFLDHAAMLMTDCWSEHPAGARSAQCPDVGTEADPG